jgi:hypothetical protein
MSDETKLGREPIQIVEVITPKCVNVHGSAPCTATQTGDRKCFNTRATCNDVDNYQARPFSHLDADLLLDRGASIASGDLTRTGDIVAVVTVFFPATPTGTIWTQGGSTEAVYLGITASELVFRAGDSSGAGTGAQVRTAVSGFAGRTVTLIASIDITGGRIALHEFDPVELVLSKIGEDTLAASNWADTGDGAIGEDASAVVTGEDGGTFNGILTTSVAFFEGQTDAVLNEEPDAYRQRYFFDDGRKAGPSDSIYILPLLRSVRTVGTRLNLTGSDGRYEPLGRRAFADLQFADALHSDFPFDPYRTDRSYDPLTKSTFWAKWLRRNKFGKTRAIVRLYHGYNGQALADMRRQTYILDAVDWSREAASVRCRDFLSATEFRRAQVPAASPGKLAADILDTDTSFVMPGDQTGVYPASGTLRIDDELMTYTGISYDSGADETTITGLTRGTDGSAADGHDVDEGVQLCRRYTAARIDDVLQEFLVSDAKIPAQVIDLARLTSEYDESLDAYTLTTLLSEPTGVDQLIGEIAEQCSFYVWWDEREQIVQFQAIKPLSSVSKTFLQGADIIGDSFQLVERPKERITTISLYYNPRDFAGDLDKPTNFKNQLVVSNSTASGPDQYGNLPQTREIFSRWLTTEAQMNQTGSRYSLRYAEVPAYVKFLADAKDRATWVGDFISISHDLLVNARGDREATRRWLVIEAEEVEPGHSQMLHAVDVTLDGLIFTITENGIGVYSEELFAAGNAFITDNAGLNPDGSTGATIG